MKLKLVVSNERYEEIKTELSERGIEIDDNADLVLSESNKFADNLFVKDTLSDERIVLPVSDIVFIETFGHTVEVHTQSKTYQAYDRLYKINNLLDPDKFLRVSNSVVIGRVEGYHQSAEDKHPKCDKIEERQTGCLQCASMTRNLRKKR